jgi:hypothetical protein
MIRCAGETQEVGREMSIHTDQEIDLVTVVVGMIQSIPGFSSHQISEGFA